MSNKEEKKILITQRSVMGALANCAVQQSPYHRPDNLEVVLDKFYEQIKDDFDEGEKYCKCFDNYHDTYRYIGERLLKIPEFLAWNERKNGNKSPYSFVSRYDKPHPDNDFIDLDALTRNITNQAIA